MATGYGEFAKRLRQGSLNPQQWNAYLMQQNQMRTAYKQAFSELQAAAQKEGLNIAPPELRSDISQAEAQEKLKAYAEQVNKNLSYFDVDVQLNTIYKNAAASGLNVPRPTQYGKTVKNAATAKLIVDSYLKKVNQAALQKNLTDAVEKIRAQAAQQGVILSRLPSNVFTGLTEAKAQNIIDNYLKNANYQIAVKNYNDAVNSISAQAKAQGVKITPPAATGITTANVQAMIDRYAASVNNALLQKSVSDAIDSIYTQAKGYGVEVPKPSINGITEANAQTFVDNYLNKVNNALANQPVNIGSTSGLKSADKEIIRVGPGGTKPNGKTHGTGLVPITTGETTLSRPEYIVRDDLGREVTITESQLQQMQKAQANRKSSENFTVLPEEVANSKADWWINSQGLYEWVPVTASDKAHLERINKQRAYLNLPPKSTLTCGASPSAEYSKEWYSTGGKKTLAKVGSGDIKIQKMKAGSSVNVHASARSGTAQQAKAVVVPKAVDPNKLYDKYGKEIQRIEHNAAKASGIAALTDLSLSGMLRKDPKTGQMVLVAERGAIEGVQEFKTVDQIAQGIARANEDAIRAKARAEALKVNPKASEEYLRGVEDVAVRANRSTWENIKADINHARTQASKAVSSILPDLDKIAKIRDAHLAGIKVTVTSPKGETRKYTALDTQRKYQKAVKENVVTAGLLKFTEDEYNFLRDDPLKYAAETGLIAAGGAAIGAGTAGLKAVVNPRLTKVAGKTVGKHGVDAALTVVPAAIGVASVHQYLKSDDYKALSNIEKEATKVQMVAGGFRTLKDFAVAAPGFKAGSKAMEGTISKVKAKKASPSTVKIDKPSGLENALPSEFDITNVARYAPKVQPKTITQKVTALKQQVAKLEAKGKASDKPKIKQLKQQINAIEKQKENRKALASMRMKNRADIKAVAEVQAFDSELANLRRMKAFADEYGGSALRARPTESDLSKALDTFTPSEIARIDAIKTGFSSLKPKAKPMTTSRIESLKAVKSLAEGTGKASSKKASQVKAGIKEALTPKYKPSVKTVGKARNPNLAIAETARERVKLLAQARRIEEGLEKARIKGDVTKEALYSVKAAKFRLTYGISTKKALKIGTGKTGKNIVEKTLGQKRSEYEAYKEAHKKLKKRRKSTQDFEFLTDVTDVVKYAKAFENSPAGRAKAIKAIHSEMKRALKGAKKDKEYAAKPKDITDVVGYRRAKKTGAEKLTTKDLALHKARNAKKYSVNSRSGKSWDSLKSQALQYSKQVRNAKTKVKDVKEELPERFISESPFTTRAQRNRAAWEKAHERLVQKNAKAKEAKKALKDSEDFKALEEKHAQAHERIMREKAKAKELERKYRDSDEYKAKEEAHFNKWIENQKQKSKKREELAGKKAEKSDDHFKAWEHAQKEKTRLRELEREYKKSDEYKAKEEAHFEAWMRSQKAKMEKRERKAASQRQEILQSTQAGREVENISFDLEMIAKEVEKAGLKREDKFLAAKKKTQQSFENIRKNYTSGSSAETSSGGLKLLQKTETVAKQLEIQKLKRTKAKVKVAKAEQKTKTVQKTKVISKKVKPERGYFGGRYLPVSTVDGYEYIRYPPTTPLTITGIRSIKQVEQVINSISTTLKTSPETLVKPKVTTLKTLPKTPVKPKVREITKTHNIPSIKPRTVTQEKVKNELNVPVIPRTKVKSSTTTLTKVDPVIKNIIKEVTVVTGIPKIPPGYKVRVPPPQKGVITAGKKPQKQTIKAKDPKGIARYVRRIQNQFGNLETMFGSSTAKTVKKTVKKTKQSTAKPVKKTVKKATRKA